MKQLAFLFAFAALISCTRTERRAEPTPSYKTAPLYEVLVEVGNGDTAVNYIYAISENDAIRGVEEQTGLIGIAYKYHVREIEPMNGQFEYMVRIK